MKATSNIGMKGESKMYENNNICHQAFLDMVSGIEGEGERAEYWREQITRVLPGFDIAYAASVVAGLSPLDPKQYFHRDSAEQFNKYLPKIIAEMNEHSHELASMSLGLLCRYWSVATEQPITKIAIRFRLPDVAPLPARDDVQRIPMRTESKIADGRWDELSNVELSDEYERRINADEQIPSGLAVAMRSLP